eukprot:11556327-Ditylum_brightwellii.AAC.1
MCGIGIVNIPHFYKRQGKQSFYTGPYGKIGGKSKGLSIQGYEVNWPSKITKALSMINDDWE